MTNKSAREALESIYGKGCMFRRARIAQRIEEMGGIKTFKRFLSEKRYTLKKIKKYERNLTFHHLRHRSEGGSTTVYNGSEVNELAHQYLHSLPRDQEEVINNMLRQFKKEFELKGGLFIPTESGLDVKQPFILDIDFDSIGEDYIEIPVFDTTKEDKEKPKKYNRAKEKQYMMRKVQEELYLDEDDELEL